MKKIQNIFLFLLLLNIQLPAQYLKLSDCRLNYRQTLRTDKQQVKHVQACWLSDKSTYICTAELLSGTVAKTFIRLTDSSGKERIKFLDPGKNKGLEIKQLLTLPGKGRKCI